MRARYLVPVLVGLLLPACSLLRRGEREFEPAPIFVVVENRNWNQMVIYAVSSGRRQRLGEVETNTSAQFTLPQLFTARTDLRLIADPIGSRQQFRTDNILVSPGGTINLILENNLRLSRWMIR